MWNSPWIRGNSSHLPIYSGQKGCLGHWVSWNRGEPYVETRRIEHSAPGDDAKDITNLDREDLYRDFE